MELKILKERQAPLLNRKRVNIMVDFQGGPTPSILDFKEAIAKQLKVNKELVAIRHIYQKYGAPQAKVIAHIYKDRKELLSLEKLKKAERKVIEAEKKAAEEVAKAETPAEEAKAPAEEKAE